MIPEGETIQITDQQNEMIPPPPDPTPPDLVDEPVAIEVPDGSHSTEDTEEIQEEHPSTITLDEDATYLVTVIIKNRGDTMRDKLRLRQVYGTLISFPGKDRFVFQIIENDTSHLLEFPNASTKISKGLINQLRDMVGRENVQVEKYWF